ncbi:MAG: OmpA family protein [Bacteroidetes bacterium]|nr:OmpA family protein [Bacteroidota bacterium]
MVSKKKFDEQEALAKKNMAEKRDCNEKLDKANADIANLNDQISKLNGEIADLKNKNLSLSEQKDRLTKANEDANKLYESLKNQYQDLSKSSSKDKEKLSLALAEKEATLNDKQAELQRLSDALKEREKRVKDLEASIARKEEALADLKKKITDALTGFASDELKVTQKDGKVYVSLSDKLLFKSGSFAVDEKGKSAIVKVAEVMNKLTDVTLVVEGHTDNKQYTAAKGEVKNNWDLSAMRAAAVTNIVVNDGKLDPRRVVAEGRGEFYPVASNDTPEGRSQNRRIELVLSPDLKEIFKILDTSNQ